MSVASSVNSIRWAVNVAKWTPTTEEWDSLLGFLSATEAEEVHRINKFHFRVDAKRCVLHVFCLFVLVFF